MNNRRSCHYRSTYMAIMDTYMHVCAPLLLYHHGSRTTYACNRGSLPTSIPIVMCELIDLTIIIDDVVDEPITMDELIDPPAVPLWMSL